jgi:hypothetical protein
LARSDERPAGCASAVWANPDSESSNPSETTDAPKMKAREILAPSAILPQSKDLLFGSGWRALAKRCERLAGYQNTRRAPARITFILVTLR